MIETRQLRVAAGDLEIGPIDLKIDAGAYAVLTGPTGSGKTTLVEAIAGLRPLGGGTVALGGVDVTNHRPADRRVGYAPQDAALFPTMTVRDNLAFGLRARGAPRGEAARRVGDLAEQLAICPLLDRKPDRLSGGEQRRVALGRALAPSPDILLLDEPLTGLDAETRSLVRSLLKALHAESRFTVLHISHDEEDADQLADTLLRMNNGRLVAATNTRTG